MTDTNPMEPIHKLGQRLTAALNPLGLTVEAFSVMPALNGGPDQAQVFLTIDAETIGKDMEQAEFDAEFDKMMRGQKEAEDEATAKEQQKRLQERFNKGGSFLPTEDP